MMALPVANLAALAAVLLLVSTSAAHQPQKIGHVSLQYLEDEIQAWKQMGLPGVLRFRHNHGRVGFASVVHRPARVPADDNISKNVHFHFYSKSSGENNVGGTVVSANVSSLVKAGWDSKLPTKIVIHGFDNDIYSPMVQGIKNAYLSKGSFNVLGVDWSVLCELPFYISARENVPDVASLVGEMVQLLIGQKLTTPHKLHIIGHSLGAHVAGIAAKALNINAGVRPGRVTGLDPAWPLFTLANETGRLDSSDADEVDVIHTCAGLLGYPKPLGSVDFYPNGGRDQPGCILDILGDCAHDRSYEYFVESIKDRGYSAQYCKNYEDARKGKCSNNTEGCMGDTVKFKEEGSYFMRTHGEDPIKTC